jgi:DeoR/GlpR family transcriptional regulator of sugar metabolism
MLLDERRNQILQLVEIKGFVSLHDLTNDVQASESTIRRDLEYLDGIGQVRRTRGGAAYVGESLSGFEERRSQATGQKQQIAAATAKLVHSGETILLDGGTTTLEVARQLIGKSLQVVTNSLPIINLLVSQPEIELMVIGGYLYPKTGVFLGPLAASALQDIHARQLIVSVGGITEKGLFNRNALLVETELKMIEAADEVIVVSDSSKLGHSALSQLCPLDVVDRLVIDSGITSEWKELIEQAGVELTIVDA